MRIEWDLENFKMGRQEIRAAFGKFERWHYAY